MISNHGPAMAASGQPVPESSGPHSSTTSSVSSSNDSIPQEYGTLGQTISHRSVSEGRWGEDVGVEAVDINAALEDFES